MSTHLEIPVPSGIPRRFDQAYYRPAFSYPSPDRHEIKPPFVESDGYDDTAGPTDQRVPHVALITPKAPIGWLDASD